MSSATEVAAAHMSDCSYLFWDSGFVSDGVWYPSNCLLHRYTADEISKCFRQVKEQNLNAEIVSSLTHSRIKMTVTSPAAMRMVFLNALCNKILFPPNTTCCLPQDTHSLVPAHTILLLLVYGCLVYFIIVRRLLLWEPKEGLSRNAQILVVQFSQLFFILGYLYQADRTSLLGVMAIVSRISWFMPLLLMAVVSTVPVWTATRGDSKAMSRGQTDETKGWMQIVILVYHYVGGREVAALFHLVRVLVASYLFLSGFGHFMYFWTTGDFGIRRFIQVLLRLNLFTVLVAMVMGSVYEQYYFPPLVSFWFIVLYTFMATWPRLTHQTVMESPHFRRTVLCALIKFAVLFVAIEILVSLQERFEAVFSVPPLRWVFSDSSGSLHEWWFRLQLDRHAVWWGMFGAFVVGVSRECDRLKQPKLPPLLLSAVSVVIIMSVTFTFCEDKAAEDALHTRLAVVPIVAFLVLRNVSPFARSTHNAAISLVGRISLELCVCQVHIWLAYDMRGLLVYIGVSSALNFIVSTVIFVTISCWVHYLTRSIVSAVTGV